MATISTSITSLVTIATNTIALALGGMLCMFISILLVELLRKLSFSLVRPQTNKQRLSEKPSTSDPEPATSDGLDPKAVQGMTGFIAFVAYLMSVVIRLSTNETFSRNEALPAVALGASIMVMGIAIGLAVTAAIGAVTWKCADYVLRLDA